MPSTPEQRHIASEILHNNSPIQSHERRRACALVAEEMKQDELVHLSEVINWIDSLHANYGSRSAIAERFRNDFAYEEVLRSEQPQDARAHEEADDQGKGETLAEEGASAHS